MNMCHFELWFAQGLCPVMGFLSCMVVLFLRNLHNVLHSSCINFDSYKQYKRILFSPPSLQYLLFVDLLMMDILTGVR